MTVIFKGENLWAKIRYNIHHNNTELRWRLFVKEGDNPEQMFLCKEVFIYVDGRTFGEEIDGVGHYSLIYNAPRIVIDGDLNGWVLKK